MRQLPVARRGSRTPRVASRTGLALALAAGVAMSGLAGCGAQLAPSSGGHNAASTVRPTRSASRPAAAKRPAHTKTSPKPSKRPSPKGSSARPTKAYPVLPSDDKGRRFDLGTIVRVNQVKDVPVIVLDRWSVRGRDDAQVAVEGYPMARHTDQPFYDQNTTSTYDVPVAQHAVFVRQRCTSPQDPIRRSSTTLTAFTAAVGSSTVVLLQLNSAGQVTRASNDPRCP